MIDNIYDLINNGDFNVEGYGDIKLNDMENRRMKKKFKKSNDKQKGKLKKAAAGFVVALAVSGVFLSTEAGAQVMGQFNESIESFLTTNKNLEDYKTVVNKSITDNGVTIQLNEVILDDDDLIISTNISSNKILGEFGSYHPNESIYVNGKKVSHKSVNGSSKKIDDYTTQSVLHYDISSIKKEELNGEIDIKILYTGVNTNIEDKKSFVRGKWKFEFKTSQDKLTLNTKKIDLKNSFILPNNEEIMLQSYRSNDVGQKIYAIAENGDNKELYNIELRGYDDLGNEVCFYLKHSENEKRVFVNEKVIDVNAKKLILKPYAVEMPKESGQMSNDFEEVGEEFEIDLTKLN